MKASVRILNVITLMITTIFVTGDLWGQTAKNTDPNFWPDLFGQMVLIGGCIVLAAAFLTIVRLFTAMVKLQEIQLLREKGLEQVAEHYAQPQQSVFAKIWQKMQGTVPLAKEKDIMFDHEYDGIRELDNKMRRWWLWLFYITIVIAGIYFYVYHISGTGLSSKEQYALQMETAQKEIDDYLSRQADQVNEQTVTKLSDEKALAEGASIYQTLCSVCHGPAGEGGVGPNMTDPYWIHGGDIKNLFRTINYGVPEKGMISWSAQLRASDIQKVASYILSLQGTNPQNGKAPQGDLWVSSGQAMQNDTTSIQ